jgi:ABC-type multidrug transport system ATPase subunit
MLVTIHQLGKRFNREWIFKDFTFEFSSGNIYAITGPNGSGKSTLMQVLWGQLPPSNGTIKYTIDRDNIEINHLHKYISIASPYMDLPETLSLMEIIEFHFRFKKIRNNHTFESVVESMGFENALNKSFYQFSSGMKQRLKLGLALLSKAELIFLDEPGTNLDNKSLEWYQNMLKLIGNESICIIASNDLKDFPNKYEEVNLLNIKRPIG